MTERPPHAIAGEYDNRDEYRTDARGLAAEIDTSLKKVDKVLLLDKANEYGTLYYSGDGNAAVTELALSYIDTQEEESYIFVKGTDAQVRQLMRKSVLTDIVVRTESYPKGREDLLSDLTEVTIEEFVEDTHYPFIAKYVIEQFYGGSIQTYVQRTDVIKGIGLDEREMLGYDLREFQQQLAVIEAIRQRVLVTNGPAEEDYGTHL